MAREIDWLIELTNENKTKPIIVIQAWMLFVSRFFYFIQVVSFEVRVFMCAFFIFVAVYIYM